MIFDKFEYSWFGFAVKPIEWPRGNEQDTKKSGTD